VADLRGREAVREAEEVVATLWADSLNAAVRADPRQYEALEFEQLSLARAARKRGKAARRDRRRLTALGEETAEPEDPPWPVRNPRTDGDGSSASSE
jgi:hypothetical protein